MNAEPIQEHQRRAREQIKVMQAFVEGRALEIRTRGEEDWMLCGFPSWDWNRYDYRIKLEPKVIYVNEYDTSYVVHGSEEIAMQRAGPSATRKAVKYQEVF